MADQQLDSDSARQRKRISVACGRCRKRKIRCSGDPGQGQPCTNCKNAGADPCLFLRVQSREAPLREDSGEFSYSVGDARAYASRAPMNHSHGHGHGLGGYTADVAAGLSSNDVLASYRPGSAYPYAAASKPYYPAVTTYGSPYGDDFDYAMGMPPQSVLGHDAASIMHSQWPSPPRSNKPPAYSNLYADPDSPYGYSSASLVQRPVSTVSADSPNFSFSSVAASLPSATSADRLLPYPASGRPPLALPAGLSSGLPYPVTAKTGVLSAGAPAVAPSTSSLADVASAATYATGFDGSSGLHYQTQTQTQTQSQTQAASNTLGGHQQTAPSSRTNSDAFTSGAETIFGEHERSLQSQGPAFDLSAYTSEPRRDSVGSTSHGGGATLSNGQTYVPSEATHETHPSHHLAFVTDSSPPHTHAAAQTQTQTQIQTQAQAHRHPHSHNHGYLSGAGAGSTSHADIHRDTAVTRR
ncbi:hypothetical protein B0T26DRAFT_854382 [Lasiosphaeria miniovina]|uniref:Zn(2)-C6 fungal-type domain-containing protein n=1 Tax=Lasiosphaeria miniovina TaxID=1954250 RepID=A0AA40DXL5_9PEZI|nr:uncharacterized protein B0T26DRAFT_854382 [Lasiosphaeria miniovina]KAK0717397.1 hypothetical protein B0T26DRAFT_854382 [Lasiosphaeria miniovina]